VHHTASGYIRNGVAFWYALNGDAGSQVKMAWIDSETIHALWRGVTLPSTNHSRLVVLPCIKESGERVGRTKNKLSDGPTNPRHAEQHVKDPFKYLKDDLETDFFG